jgi:hypothetical protein
MIYRKRQFKSYCQYQLALRKWRVENKRRMELKSAELGGNF